LEAKLHVWLSAGLLGLALVASPRGAAAHPDGSFPRTYNLDWVNNPDALRDSKFDVVSLSSRAQAAKWDSIKALNPACKRLAGPAFYIYYYVGPSGYPSQSSGPFAANDPVYGSDRRYWDLLNDNQWWAWSVDSLGTRYHASAFYEMWLGNFSSHCPRNAQGKRLCDVYGDWVVDNLVTPHGAEGVFFDNTWDGPSWLEGGLGGCQNLNCTVQTPGAFNRSWIDLDADGVADNPDSADAWWKAGVSIVFQRIRTRMGANFVIAGNGQHHYAMASGAMHERFPRIFGPADPAPNPYGYAWQWCALGPNGYLSSWQTYFSQPTYNFIDTELGGGDRYHYPLMTVNQQLFRFNLGSTLLGDGYMGLNNGGYNCYYWQPEYDLQLGFPRGPASSQVLSGLTVWKRDFTNGVVWVNPTGYALPAGANNPAVGGWDASITQLADTIDVPPVTPPPVVAFGPSRPNPFPTSGSTTLSFTIAANAPARLDILDMRGRLVRKVWNGYGTGDVQSAVWDGRTDEGWVAPVGVYFARLEGPAGKASQQKLIRTP
jgi:hypothetical protein